MDGSARAAPLIADPDLQGMVEDLARLHGSEVKTALRRILEDAKAEAEEDAAHRRRVAEIQAAVARLPVLDPRGIDALLFDDDGLPI